MARQAVVSGHLVDEGDGFLREPRWTRFGLGFGSPVTAKEVPMPAEKGVGLDQVEGLLSVCGKTGQQKKD